MKIKTAMAEDTIYCGRKYNRFLKLTVSKLKSPHDYVVSARSIEILYWVYMLTLFAETWNRFRFSTISA